MANPNCLISKVTLKRPGWAAFKTLSSCHDNNPYGGINDYFVRRGPLGSRVYDLSSLSSFVKATR